MRGRVCRCVDGRYKAQTRRWFCPFWIDVVDTEDPCFTGYYLSVDEAITQLNKYKSFSRQFLEELVECLWTDLFDRDCETVKTIEMSKGG